MELTDDPAGLPFDSASRCHAVSRGAESRQQLMIEAEHVASDLSDGSSWSRFLHGGLVRLLVPPLLAFPSEISSRH